MIDDIAKIAAIITAVSSLLWPVIAIAALIYIPRMLLRLVERKGVTLKIAGFEIATEDALTQYGESIAELQEKLAELERRLAPGAATPRAVSSTAATPAAGAISVLWVDDFPNNNAFIVERLRNEGDQVDLAFNTDQGLGYLSRRKYDAVISDLGRKEPGGENPLAGMDFVRKMRVFNSETPVLIYASKRAVDMRDQLLAAGAQGVTTSPVDVFAFLDRTRVRIDGN